MITLAMKSLRYLKKIKTSFLEWFPFKSHKNLRLCYWSLRLCSKHSENEGGNKGIHQSHKSSCQYRFAKGIWKEGEGRHLEPRKIITKQYSKTKSSSLSLSLIRNLDPYYNLRFAVCPLTDIEYKSHYAKSFVCVKSTRKMHQRTSSAKLLITGSHCFRKNLG